MTVPERESRYERFFPESEDPVLSEFQHRDRQTLRREIARYEYGRDYDRILYSSAFRKLGGVTQVVTSRELGDFHNRLTHSLKVAQTGVRATSWILRNGGARQKQLAEDFGGLNPAVVRAACIAHDIGHPPFGHIGESALQDIASRPSKYLPGFPLNPVGQYPQSWPGLSDSFEGNAQSFRTVTRLAFRNDPLDPDSKQEPALNLTRATLAALSKYPWSRDDPFARSLGRGKKWGAYATEAELLAWVMKDGPGTRETIRFGKPHTETRTIEAQVMDWADDIAYAVHDIEDFYRVGLIPLHVIAEGGNIYREFVESAYEKLSATGQLPNAWLGDRGEFAAREVSEPEIRQALESFGVVGDRQGVFHHVPAAAYNGSREHRRKLHDFASSLIQRATSDLEITEAGVLSPRDPNVYLVLEVLKHLTEVYVVGKPVLGSAQVGQQRLLTELVASLYEWSYGHGLADDAGDGALSLPVRLRDFMAVSRNLNSQQPKPMQLTGEIVLLRAIIDYVSSLTDDQARAYHDRVCAGRSHSMLDSWLFN